MLGSCCHFGLRSLGQLLCISGAAMSIALINAINNMKNVTFASFLCSRKFPSVGSRSPSKLCIDHHYNRLATDFDDFNVDIYDSSQDQQTNHAIAASQVLWIKVLHQLENESRWSSSHVLDPIKSNCVWLTVDKLSRGGIGHSFRAWDLFLQLSVLEKYTYYAPFFTPFHGLCNLKETVDFFGFHNVFYWARAPPPSAVVIPVGDPINGGCDQELVRMAAYYYQERYGKFNCNKNHIIFYCYNFGKGTTTFSTSFKDSLHISSIVFEVTRKMHRAKYAIAAVEKARKRHSIVIAVHIRRGDILSSKYIEKKRLVSFGFYKSVLKELIALRSIHDKRNDGVFSNHISIFILTEGKKQYSDDKHTLVEYKIDSIDPSRVISSRSVKLFPINVTDSVGSFCSEETHCDIGVFSNVSLYSSFLTLCESDVLVTGASQLSVMAMALCQPRLSLAVQFGDDFRGLRSNVLVMRANDETYGLWHSNASILWTQKKHKMIAAKVWQNIEKLKRST